MYNFRTGQMEVINVKSNFRDFVPQTEVAQVAFQLRVDLGDTPMEAIATVLANSLDRLQNEHVALDSIQQSIVVAAIIDERSYQDQKWGTIEQNPHTVGEWILILRAELEEAEHAWRKTGDMTAALAEIRQVGAVAVACLEQHGVRFRQPNGWGIDGNASL